MHTHYIILVYMKAQMYIFINWDTYMSQCVCACVGGGGGRERDGRDQDIDNTLYAQKKHKTCTS